MPFKKVLNEIVDSVPKATGAIIVDFEGECVQLVTKKDEYELKVLGAYQVINFDTLKRASLGGLIKDKTNTLIIRTEGIGIVTMRIDDDYYVSLIIEMGSSLSAAEFILKNKLEEIKRIM